MKYLISSSDSDEVEIMMRRKYPEVEDESLKIEIVKEQCDVNVDRIANSTN